jgi:hypothetical protein
LTPGSSSPLMSAKSLGMKLKSENIFEYDADQNDPEILKNNLEQINNLVSARLENSQLLENTLPSKYIQYDPGCIRKYSNFSFPVDYKYFYDFVDYFPPKKVCEENELETNDDVKTFLETLKRPNMKRDFIDTLKLVSPKTLTLLNKIKELDAKDMAQYGKKFKHFIFSDSKSSMAGVKLLASALIADGMNLGYKAEPKMGKKNWGKIELLSNNELEKTKYNNLYMLCSTSVYDEPISVVTKKSILARFNERPDNVYGENIRIILMDGGYKEGIDLFDIKYVHIFEPTLTQADQKQVVGRGTRTCGQKGLDFHPSKGWPLYVYVYDLKMEPPFDKGLGASTGIEMYFKAKNMNIKLLNFINELETVCIQNAVDYELNKNIHSFSISFDEKGESLRGGDKSSSSIISKSNTAELNDDFFKNISPKSVAKQSSLSEPVEKSMDAAQMRKYVMDNFSQFAWDKVIMENNCVPKTGGSKQLGGATIMNYTPTQAFVSNFFTPANPLKGMLLWHSVGTGKTCSAIATATSSFEKQGYTILWVTRTTLKNDIWKNMFDQVCHEIIKLKIENEGIVIPSNNSDRMKLLSKSWRVRPMSYKQFSNLVSKKNQIYETMVKINGKEDPLRKTLLIIDEAHKLYGGGDLSTIETPDMVSLHASLMNSYIVSGSESVKLLLMTATPIQTDPMELVKLINLFKMPNKQMPDNFEVFSEQYLDDNGYFKPSGLHKFRDETAGHISYLNREKDARQFSQPVITTILTDVYDKELLRNNKRATRKLYSTMGKEIDAKLKSLKANPMLKAKTSKDYNTLKNICDSYENSKAKNACKKVVSEYKKAADEKLKETKTALKQELTDYKKVAEDFKELKNSALAEFEESEDKVRSPLLFRSGYNKTSMDQIESVYGRLSKCNKPMTNSTNLINNAVLNNPEIAQLQSKVNNYEQRIEQNSLVLKKEKNPETKKVLNAQIKKDSRRLQKYSKTLKSKIGKFTKFVKGKFSETKKNLRESQKDQKKILRSLNNLKLHEDEVKDKELERNVKSDIQSALKSIADEIELKEKAKADKAHNKTMKKMEKEQQKLEKMENKTAAKQHAKTMKNMEKEKAKEDKEFIKAQKMREVEFKKIEAAAQKEAKELEKQREKQLEREKKAAVEFEKQKAKELEKQEKEAKEFEKQRAKELEKREKEARELEKQREKEFEKHKKEIEKQREKQVKEMEKQNKELEKQKEKEAKAQANAQTKKTKKTSKGGNKTRRSRY